MKQLRLLIISLLWVVSLTANADEIPNDEIWYTASSKLGETTSNFSSCLHTNAFNTTILSHIFNDGKGVIKFDGDVTSIGSHAFYYCSDLTSITIPNSVTSIGDRAFSGCSGLISITIPNSVTSIGDYAFSGCSNLPVEGNLRYADTFLIGVVDKTLSTNTIKEGTKWIGEGAFYNCSNLTSVTIPNSVTSIRNMAFSGCSGLTSITIPNSVTNIGESAFYGCSSLTSVTFGNSVTSIGDMAFYSCSNLTSITIPNSVTSIGDGAFNNCTGFPVVDNLRYADTYLIRAVDKELSTYTIKEGTKWIGEQAFNGCSNLTSITIPNSVTSIGWSAFYGCSSLPVVDNLRYADTYLVEAVDKTLLTYIIKEGTKWIGSSAFEDCTEMKAINIPNSVTSIGSVAFQNCYSLTSITIPNSVTSIGNYAFRDCKFTKSEFINQSSLDEVSNGYWASRIYDVIQEDGLCIKDSIAQSYRGRPTLVTIPNSVTSIGSGAFYNCSNLTSVTIPNSVTSIGDRAFSGCSGLTSITIPNSVTSIGSEVFYNCSSIQSVKVSWSRPLSIGYIFTGIDYSTCILYVPKGTATLYMVAPMWINFTNIQEYSDSEEEYVISIKQGDAGCVKDVVEVGKTAQYIITPAEGWSVNSVSFNGTDVTKSLTEGRYTTPVITGNSELNVVFRQEGSGVKNLINSNVKVLASNGSVIISGNGNNDSVVVYSVGGAEVASDAGNCNIHLNAGVYLIKVGTEVFKVAL